MDNGQGIPVLAEKGFLPGYFADAAGWSLPNKGLTRTSFNREVMEETGTVLTRMLIY